MFPSHRWRPRWTNSKRCGSCPTDQLRWSASDLLWMTVIYWMLALQIRTAVKGLASQYETKEKEFDTFKQDYKIRVVGREWRCVMCIWISFLFWTKPFPAGWVRFAPYPIVEDTGILYYCSQTVLDRTYLRIWSKWMVHFNCLSVSIIPTLADDSHLLFVAPDCLPRFHVPPTKFRSASWDWCILMRCIPVTDYASHVIEAGRPYWHLECLFYLLMVIVNALGR